MKKNIKLISLILMTLVAVLGFSLYRMNMKAAGVGDFVERCYSIALDRQADTQGYNNWVDELSKGKSCGAQVAYGFIFSNEYTKKNKTNKEYVDDLYKMFFDRAGDKEGLNSWISALDNGKSREEVFAGFANSVEFYRLCEKYGVTAGHYVIGVNIDSQSGVNSFVARMYNVCLGRQGDMGGQADWVNRLLDKKIDGIGCAYGFIFSEEFQNKKCTNEEYVEYMYRAFFGRESDPAGKSSWVSILNNGGSRNYVFAGFANSAEFSALCDSYGIVRGTYECNEKAPEAKPTPVPTITPLAYDNIDTNLVFDKSNADKPEDNPNKWMAHNIYSNPVLTGTEKKFKAFMIDFKTDDMAEATYWALCNFRMNNDCLKTKYSKVTGGSAYCGLQNRPDGTKAIMSFWQVEADNDIINATLIYPVKDGNGSFDNEGSGSNYLADYAWKANNWYRMYIECGDDPVSGNTIVTMYLMDTSVGKWEKFCAYDTHLKNSYFEGGMTQFMENYSYKYATGVRSFQYANIYVQDYSDSEWHNITQSKLKVDTNYGNKKGTFAFGSTSTNLWGIVCGYGPDAAKLNEDISSIEEIKPVGNRPKTPHE